MKFGLKIWSSNIDLINELPNYKSQIDFIELTAKINTFDEKKYEILQDFKTIIHCDNDGVDFSEQNNKKNLLSTNEAEKFAQFLESDYIVIHPGYKGSIENFNIFINSLHNKSLYCVENMPGITITDKEPCLGRTFDELSPIDIDTYCLDFAHAIKSSITLKVDSSELINDLLKLKPVLFHLSDGLMENETDEHLNIGKGNFPIGELIKNIPDNALVTLEVPKENYHDLKPEIAKINNIKQMIK